ncbi:hypothetical protein [Rhizobium mongolense]|uniref:hypothetical protein n=1 Tax=Rhizobium mongolense TaxID=57676 RepID=UPI000B8413FF|nr:hypothetical protein [Rhizobium mongolense]
MLSLQGVSFAIEGRTLAAGAVAILPLSFAPLTTHWLAVLPLGETLSRSLGLGVVALRAIFLCLIEIHGRRNFRIRPLRCTHIDRGRLGGKNHPFSVAGLLTALAGGRFS